MKTKSRKAIAAVIGILVAALLACSVLLVQYVKEDLAPQVPEANAPAENGGMLIGEGEGVGVSLLSEKIEKADYEAYGVSPLAESAYTLTATVEPANAPDKAVDWSVAFVDPSSEWATGKTVTDYVTVTPTSDGALTATVQNLKAFGEQIKVTVTHRENENATASCTVDFAKRIEGVRFYSEGNGSFDFTMGTDESVSITNNTVAENLNIEFLYGDFTVEDTFSFTLTASINQSFLTAYKQKLSGESSLNYIINEVLYTWDGTKFTTAQENIVAKDFYFAPDEASLCIFDTGEEYTFNATLLQKAKYHNAVVSVIEENPSYYYYDLTINATGSHSEFTATTKISPNTENLAYKVSEINLDNSSIIF